MELFFEVLIIIFAIIFIIYLFLLAPGGRKRKTSLFFKEHSMFAHRGLHGNGVPENSLKAFSLACEAGYGIELDVHITADDKLVVFHDDTLDRMCGVSGNVEEKTLAELSSMRLAGTDEHVPSFIEVLETVGGRVPLIVEIKGQSISNTRVCELTAEALENYGGKWCIESFNPFYISWWRKNKKEAVRGILSCKMPADEFLKSRAKNFILENMLLNVIARPDFIAYSIGSRKQPSFRIARAMGGFPVAWTARGTKDIELAKKDFKAIIFEEK